jgi:hypothetical protein
LAIIGHGEKIYKRHFEQKDRLDGYGSLVCFPYKKTIEPSTHPSFPEFFFFWFSFRLLAVGNNFERLF